MCVCVILSQDLDSATKELWKWVQTARTQTIKCETNVWDVAAAGCYLWQHQAQAITRGEPLIFIFATRQRTLWLWSPVSMPLWPSAMCSGAGAWFRRRRMHVHTQTHTHAHALHARIHTHTPTRTHIHIHPQAHTPFFLHSGTHTSSHLQAQRLSINQRDRQTDGEELPDILSDGRERRCLCLLIPSVCQVMW